MITITDPEQIAANFHAFEPDNNGAFPTNRVLTGQWEQENCQEWEEHGFIDGIPAKVFYIFENTDGGEEGDNFPFDAEHCTKMEFFGEE